jgi:hypothetical protein
LETIVKSFVVARQDWHLHLQSAKMCLVAGKITLDRSAFTSKVVTKEWSLTN